MSDLGHASRIHGREAFADQTEIATTTGAVNTLQFGVRQQLEWTVAVWTTDLQPAPAVGIDLGLRGSGRMIKNGVHLFVRLQQPLYFGAQLWLTFALPTQECIALRWIGKLERCSEEGFVI